MELKAIDNSRVVYLTQVRRPKGQLFLPVALQSLLSRYHFQKFPTEQELFSETLAFQHGLFDDIGINEFSIYQDGLIVASRANTDVLDAFIADILAWSADALGLVQVDIPPQERHYESALIVTMKVGASFPKLDGLRQSLTATMEQYGLRPFEFSFSAVQVAADETAYAGRRPIPFTLVRRVQVPFESDIYFSTAPLKTNDHLAALEALERDLAG